MPSERSAGIFCRVRGTCGGTDQSPKRKRGVSPIPASHQTTRSLTLGALIALCIHVGTPSDVPTGGPPEVSGTLPCIALCILHATLRCRLGGFQWERSIVARFCIELLVFVLLVGRSLTVLLLNI